MRGGCLIFHSTPFLKTLFLTVIIFPKQLATAAPTQLYVFDQQRPQAIKHRVNFIHDKDITNFLIFVKHVGQDVNHTHAPPNCTL